MVKIQFDLTRNEKIKLERLKRVFGVEGKASVIKRLIKDFKEIKI
jgi:hypothetical protein